MANLKIDWFGRSLSHRADKTSNTYAKVNSITGKTFLVTLRNPYTSDRFKDANIAQNNKMGALWMGIAAWVKAAQATGAAAEDAAQLARLAAELPEAAMEISEATYLAWVDATALGFDSTALAARLEHEAKVKFSQGAIYGEPKGNAFLRINLACPRTTLMEALERFAKWTETHSVRHRSS